MDNNMIHYYNLYDFNELLTKYNNPDELSDYFNQHHIYGYIDFANRNYRTGKICKENYRINTTDISVKNGLHTCIEVALIVKRFCDAKGIPCQIFSVRDSLNNDDNLKLHMFAIYQINGKYHLLEQTDSLDNGVFIFDSLSEAIKSKYDKAVKFYPNGVKVTELTSFDIEGMTIQDLLDSLDYLDEVNNNVENRQHRNK